MSFLESLFGKPLPSITAAEAQAQLNGPKPPMLIDVREPSEFQMGHVAGAKLIPLGQLQRKLDTLPKDRPILCFCQSGSRSGAATRLLLTAGYNATNIQGGLIGWQMARLPLKKTGQK
jgi:rhodanese-related sulfurtransferase